MQYARWSVRSDGRVSSCTRMQLHRGGNDWSTTRSIVRLCRWSLKFKLAGKQNFICLADYSSIMIFLYPIFPSLNTLWKYFFFWKIILASPEIYDIFWSNFFLSTSFVINLLFKFHLFVGFAVQSWYFYAIFFDQIYIANIFKK